MAKRLEPVKKTTREVLDDLQAGWREAIIVGPQPALKYLTRTLEGQHSLPNAAKAATYDLLAETRARLQDWEGVEAAVQGFLTYLPDLEAALGHGYRQALEATTALERGVQARTERADFAGALDLCERAIALELGAHWTAKRDSLSWAR
jgi:hypothetical protein